MVERVSVGFFTVCPSVYPVQYSTVCSLYCQSGVQEYRCTGVQVYRCTGVQVYRYVLCIASHVADNTLQHLDGCQTQFSDLVSRLPLLPQLTLDVLQPLAAQVAPLLPLADSAVECSVV